MKFLMFFFSKIRFVVTKQSVYFFGCCLVNLFSAAGLNAQQINARATVDTNAIKIGDQFILNLEINHPSDILVNWPAMADTFSHFELVQRVPGDTLVNEASKLVTIRRHFKLTSFDSGFHVIPPFEFLYKIPGDTTLLKAETEPLLIHVQSVPVDTTRAIKDIKGNVVIPFSWQDALPYIGGLLLTALLVLIVYYLIRKSRKEKPVPVISVPRRPAHEIALEALQQLDAAKLWQQGNYKSYYTGLSDIIRTFIQNRWSVNAMEMTTDEIMRMQIISGQDPAIYVQLKQLLELADLVKFAKMIPVLHENELSLKQAIAFVESNKQVNEMKEVES